ncbi:Putative protein FAM90A-like protein [Heterocephalus glaber]|uniref:Uncharacterized protein n=1 Tax=Heterocephalus glaber TaxID=10181 RepID=G5CBE2_HETGA|nr:Putative protein FAM90A-like protein [Heterocephalus glaber]
MKSWGGVLPFQALGSNKDKENLNLKNAQQFQTPGHSSQMDREKEQRKRTRLCFSLYLPAKVQSNPGTWRHEMSQGLVEFQDPKGT